MREKKWKTNKINKYTKNKYKKETKKIMKTFHFRITLKCTFLYLLFFYIFYFNGFVFASTFVVFYFYRSCFAVILPSHNPTFLIYYGADVRVHSINYFSLVVIFLFLFLFILFIFHCWCYSYLLWFSLSYSLEWITENVF